MSDKLMQVIVFVASLAGYVALAYRDLATAEYVALVGPVLAAVILKSHLGQQDQVLGQIQEQTNGVLDRRIEEGVLKALAKREDPGT